MRAPALAIAAALASAGLTPGCGGRAQTGASSASSGSPWAAGPQPTALASVCGRISAHRIAVLAGAEGPGAHPLRRSSQSTSLLSVCRFQGRGVSVEIQLDAAPQARTRYFNRITESVQASLQNPVGRPRPVSGVGDPAIPGGGASWIPSSDQLFAIRDSHLLIVHFYVRGAAPSALRRGATHAARIGYAALAAPSRR